MIALIKTFTLQQTSAVSEHFQGTSSISSSFAVKIVGCLTDCNKVASSFAVKIDRLTDSPTPTGGNKVASSFAVKIVGCLTDCNKVVSSFALAHGGYELNGVILDKKLEKTKLIRQK